jgi:hypothetical protein
MSPDSKTTIGQYIRIQRIKLNIERKDVIEAMDYPISLTLFGLIELDKAKNIGHQRLLSLLNTLHGMGADPIDIYCLKY